MATSSTRKRHVFTIVWKIENMSFYERGIHTNGISSPPFTTRTAAAGWEFRLFPKGGDEEDKHLRICLHQFGTTRDRPIDVELSVLGSDGSSLVTGTVKNRENDTLFPISSLFCPTHKEVFITRKSEFLPNDTLTVRCRIWKSVGSFPRSECVSICSRIEHFEDSFQWPIAAFGLLPLDHKTPTEVHVSIAGGIIPFWLNFSLRGSSSEEAVAQIQITSNSVGKELFATLKVSVLDKEQKVVKSVVGKRVFGKSKDEQSWVLPPIATRRELLSRQSDCLNSGGVLTLLCEFTAVGGNISHSFRRTNVGLSDLTTGVAKDEAICSDASCTSSGTLGEDWLSLYRDQTGSDFELRSGVVSFPVHKPVLMARSPVFRAMFCSGMRESGTHSMDVPDVDAQTLNRMLTFLYAGTVDPDLQWEDAAKLYYAADKYLVQSLKQQCSSILQSGLSVSNVLDILMLADMYQDQGLASFVHDFFLRRIHDIVLSEEWDTFQERNPILARRTKQQVYKKLEMTRSQRRQD